MAGGDDKIHRCPICHLDLADRLALAQHKATEEHYINFLKFWYTKSKKVLTADKNGVNILVEDFGDSVVYDEEEGQVSISVDPGEQGVCEFTLRNNADVPVLLTKVGLLHQCDEVSLLDDHGVARGQRVIKLPPGLDYIVQCQVQIDELGVKQVPVAFQLHFEFSDKLFFIVRVVQINGVDRVARESGPVSVYRKTQTFFHSRRDFEGFVPGIPLTRDSNNDLPMRMKLDQYNVSEVLRKAYQLNFIAKNCKHYTERAEATRVKALIKEGLTERNHVDWYKTQLWLEEIQMEMDIAYYNLRNVRINRVPRDQYSSVECVEIPVPGLAEKRPSVLKGDSVYITYEGCRVKGYEGCVHRINEKTVYAALSSQFMEHFIDKKRVNVEFTFGRMPLRVSHRALELVEDKKLQSFIFPTPRPAKEILLNIKPKNRRVEENPEQLEAVRHIVSGSSKPAPYVVFGPPGTGKTVTIVEAIKQIYHQNKNNRVLVGAPSNAACDNITEKLMEHIPARHLFRMHAASREIISVPEKIKPVSNWDGGKFFFPNESRLLEFRVIVSTLITASKIAAAGLPKGSITHVFVEECGQAMEPEALVAVAGVLARDGQLVLAGDPYQLGPVIRNYFCYSSSYAFKQNGLDKSLLERLMEMDMYKPLPANRHVVTKLLKNYRSHENILRLPNQMFYDSELQACADPVYVESLCQWEHLPRKGFPLLFNGVKGKDEREKHSPSFFNAQEVRVVIDYVKKLLNTRVNKVSGKEIGIITPYRQQVTKIRMQINKLKDAVDIKVGSPEEFQGDERRVIIISTVRASVDFLEWDLRHQLGFLSNPKRFNVAVTRAKALLIMVGCPEVLSLDKHWGALLKFIRSMGGYCGKPYDPSAVNEVDKSIVDKFNAMNLTREALEQQGARQDPNARQRAEEPAWYED